MRNFTSSLTDDARVKELNTAQMAAIELQLLPYLQARAKTVSSSMPATA
eukprot:IDg11446t1